MQSARRTRLTLSNVIFSGPEGANTTRPLTAKGKEPTSVSPPAASQRRWCGGAPRGRGRAGPPRGGTPRPPCRRCGARRWPGRGRAIGRGRCARPGPGRVRRAGSAGRALNEAPRRRASFRPGSSSCGVAASLWKPGARRRGRRGRRPRRAGPAPPRDGSGASRAQPVEPGVKTAAGGAPCPSWRAFGKARDGAALPCLAVGRAGQARGNAVWSRAGRCVVSCGFWRRPR